MSRWLGLVVMAAGLLALPAAAQMPPPGGGPPAGAPPRLAGPGLPATLADAAYATVSPAQRFDLWRPDGPGPFPLVINIHGGGFMMGSRAMLNGAMLRALLARGVAVASVDYRLSGEARFPAAVQDVKAAVRHLRANAAAYRLDPARFVAFGQSAGGNLAAMLGTSDGEPGFDDPALGNAGVSSRVQAVVDWFGPSDFTLLDSHARQQGCPADHDAADSPESRWLGIPVPQAQDLAHRANPARYADAGDPPFLLQKGALDCLVPVAQSQLLHERLRAAGVKAHLDILPGAGHGDMGLATPVFGSPANIERVVGFITEIVSR